MSESYGLLVAGFNYSNVAADEFHDWLDTEHVPAREQTKGFIGVQRWLGVDDPKVSIATYDLEALSVLQSPDYLKIGGANTTPWSKRVVAKCEKVCRFEGNQIVPGQQAAPSNAGALLLVALNVAPEVEDELNDWYEHEHMPRLAAVEGSLCARRFKMPAGTHRYLALFHLTSPEVQASAAWKAAADSPWTRKMGPQIRDRLRLVLRPYDGTRDRQ